MVRKTYTHNEIVPFEEDQEHEFKGFEEAQKRLPEKELIKEIFDYSVENISAFLNTNSGMLYLGIEDDGRITGVRLNRSQRDDVKKRISQAVDRNFYPSVEPDLYHIEFIPVLGAISDTFVIEIRVLKGPEPVYWINSKGKAYLRRKAGNFPMSPDMITRRTKQENKQDILEKTLRSRQKSKIQTSQPLQSPKKSNKNKLFGGAALLGLICIGICLIGVVFNSLLSNISPTRPVTTPTTIQTEPELPAASLDTATPKPTATLTKTPNPTATPEPTPTNTSVVVPTDIPTLTVTPVQELLATPTPLPVDEPISQVGDLIIIEDWEIRVERVEFAEELTGITNNTEKAAGRFVLVFLTVINHGLSNDTFVAFGSLEIQDSESRTYEENFVASGYASYQFDTDSGVVLNPDETGHMVAVFDIPKRSDLYKLVPGTLARKSTGSILLNIP